MVRTYLDVEEKKNRFIIKSNSHFFLTEKDEFINGVDIFVCYSTLEDSVSFRSKRTGSFFIQFFCDVLEELGDTLHMEEIATSVIDKLAKKRIELTKVQIPQKYSTLRKNFFLPLRK